MANPFHDQTVLVTGSSGTFGHAAVSLALTSGARRVIGIARNEHRQSELRHQHETDARLECWIGDVRDQERLRWAFRSQPDVILHAAAMKRIEICQLEPDEAVKTNIEGTRNVMAEAMLANVPRVLLISSDKAVASETVYGATKAAAEAVALGQNARRGHGRTRVSVVRYGNVIGSQGSVLGRMVAARETGRMPITDPEATRFWWSIEDAVRFVSDVVGWMRGAEIWIPKIPSAKVADVAAAIAPRARQHVIGSRGPEKVHEAMIAPTEARYGWELDQAFVLLPFTGQPWSPDPPPGARPLPSHFSYTSADDPLPVRFAG